MLVFGTDGVRGRFNDTLRADQILNLGLAHGAILRQWHPDIERPQVVVGRDSRLSGDALMGAYGAGLMSQGVDLIDIGVIPTPAVAFAVKHLGAQAGAMLSASHNPVPDNGIKLFTSEGKKLTDEQSRKLEQLLNQTDSLPLVDGEKVGQRLEAPGLKSAYREFLIKNLEGSLSGLKIVLDCGHGAASGHAEEIFCAAGAEVVMIHDTPEGDKINVDCGSTDLGRLQEAVVANGADMGFAFDGDADRCLGVCEKGSPLSGDQMMVVVASALKERGRLPGDRVVLTVMSNLGAEIALKEIGIDVLRTAVGDRYVYEEMVRSGAVLGGEQSGHILFLDRHWSGDGMLAGLVFAGVVGAAKKRVSELIASIPEMPQKLVNVGGVDKDRLDTDAEVQHAIKLAEAKLSDSGGRLLVRPSGTEPLVRLMAEGPDSELLDSVLEELRGVVLARLSRLEDRD